MKGPHIQFDSAATQDPIILSAHKGDWLLKFAYSDSKCIKRFFWLSSDLKELRWGTTMHDKRYLSVELSELIGMTYGPQTTTFSKLRSIQEAPKDWLCFSLIFVGRTLDLSTIHDNAHEWFQAIQYASRVSGGSCLTLTTRTELIRRKVMMKIRTRAQSLGLGLAEHLRRTIARIKDSDRVSLQPVRKGQIFQRPVKHGRDFQMYISELRNSLATIRKSIEVLQRVDFSSQTARRLLEFLSSRPSAESTESRESAYLRKELEASQVEVRKLHNELMDLKGNIRVFARVRPMLRDEVEEAVSVKDYRVSIYNENDARCRTFEFDSAFSQSASQAEVFDGVKPFITSFIHGYNVCLFAYGVTNSGKTYTMEGEGEASGINFLACEFILRNLRDDVMVSISAIQIYNETVYDLLNDRSPLEIKSAGDAFVLPDISECVVKSASHAISVMHEAARHRATNATKLNISSSRSHFVVTLRLRSATDPSHVISKLNLIDLAGSENVNRSGATGIVLQEAKTINKSLAALGDVMHALIQTKIQSRVHIPFRNSKLTMLLRDSLQGNSKVIMMVQISPKQADVTESLGTLQFGVRVRTVELGRAKRLSVEGIRNENFFSPTRE